MTLHTSGRLIRDAERKTSQQGKPYGYALISAATYQGDQVIQVTACDDDLINLLASLKKGDSLSVTGSCTVGVYENRDGVYQPSVSVMANHIMALVDTKAKPKPRKPKQPDERQFEYADFDDTMDNV